MAKKYLIKEITCPTCNGVGYYYLEGDIDNTPCQVCKETGYVIEEYDRTTGYRIIDISEVE